MLAREEEPPRAAVDRLFADRPALVVESPTKLPKDVRLDRVEDVVANDVRQCNERAQGGYPRAFVGARDVEAAKQRLDNGDSLALDDLLAGSVIDLSGLLERLDHVGLEVGIGQVERPEQERKELQTKAFVSRAEGSLRRSGRQRTVGRYVMHRACGRAGMMDARTTR
jgi:hypothetical protein